jgi:hypothetical protein
MHLFYFRFHLCAMLNIYRMKKHHFNLFFINSPANQPIMPGVLVDIRSYSICSDQNPIRIQQYLTEIYQVPIRIRQVPIRIQQYLTRISQVPVGIKRIPTGIHPILIRIQQNLTGICQVLTRIKQVLTGIRPIPIKVQQIRSRNSLIIVLHFNNILNIN